MITARRNSGYGDHDPKEEVDSFISGLYSDRMREWVMLKEPKDWKEAREYCLEYDKKVTSKRKKKYNSSDSSDSDSSNSSDDSDDHDEDSESDGSDAGVKVTKKKDHRKVSVEVKAKGKGKHEEKDKRRKEDKNDKGSNSESETVTKNVKKHIDPILAKIEQAEKARNDQQQQQQKQMELLSASMQALSIQFAGSRQDRPTRQAGGQGGPVVCYNCQQSGHIAYQCTNVPNCRRCGGSHTTRECRASGSNAMPQGQQQQGQGQPQQQYQRFQ